MHSWGNYFVHVPKAADELSGIDCHSEKELNNPEKRVKWLKTTDKRVIIHFTPYHGSWLNLVEFWFGIMNKKVLKENAENALNSLFPALENYLWQNTRKAA